MTPAIRAASDEVDRSHPESSGQSLRADVGGRLIVRSGERKVASIRVGGPRATPLGPIGRYRAKLRVRAVRAVPGGAVPVGGDEAGALELSRREVRVAAGLWGQCGITFGPLADLDVKVVDPPPAHLLAIGCNLGLPASGGTITLSVAKRRVSLQTRSGDRPSDVAQAVKAAIVRAGYQATVSPNPRTEAAAFPTVDVLVRDGRGRPATLAPVQGQPLSTDRTLGVCLGLVDLTDGLDHFTDYDSMSGTVEERSLIKGLADDDPTTVEVFVIPSFSEDSRIGESFIVADGSALGSTVVLDRTAVRVGARSFALAHELGHVFLNMPGHPDDYGVDTSSSLMDSDAIDPTVFGPRRPSVDECVTAIVESGPAARLPLLESWPLYATR
jgi:hypothetical protein